MRSTSRDLCQLIEWWHSLQFVCIRLGCLPLSISCLNLFLCPGNPALEDTAQGNNWERKERSKSIELRWADLCLAWVGFLKWEPGAICICGRAHQLPIKLPENKELLLLNWVVEKNKVILSKNNVKHCLKSYIPLLFLSTTQSLLLFSSPPCRFVKYHLTFQGVVGYKNINSSSSLSVFDINN